MNISLIQSILNDLFNTDFSVPQQDNPYYAFLYELAENLPSGESKIDLDSNFPYTPVGEEVPDWRTSLFDSQGNVKPIWNESLKHLWEAIHEYRKQPTDADSKDLRTIDVHNEPAKPWIDDSNEVLIDDIRYADAGYNLNINKTPSEQMFEEWVKPWGNLAGNTYREVRGTDFIFKQVIDKIYLQFTNQYSIDDERSGEGRDIINSEIRLLMPKNSRKVFIEDLNRNFWVIGNVVGGICAYIFGASSPLKDIYSRLLQELIQLWENTICLWLLACLTLLKPCTDIHVEMFFVPESEDQLYRKYDNFDEFGDIESKKWEIVNRTVAYAKKYQGSNCAMFPCIRKNNYEKNYFDAMVIPYVVFIIRQGGGEDKVVVQELTCNNRNNWIEVCPHAYRKNLWCARETDMFYYYSYPLNDIPAKRDASEMAHKYYGGLRPEILISNKAFRGGNIVLEGVNIVFSDAVGMSFYLHQNTEIWYHYDTLSSDENGKINDTVKDVILSSAESTEVLSKMPRDRSGSAFYFGDFPTDYDISVQGKHFTVISEDNLKTKSYLIKIGQYLPKVYNTNTGLQTSTIYTNPEYFSEQLTSSLGRTSYELNYTPNNKSFYSYQGLPLSQSEFYVCDASQPCFLRSEDLNAKDNPTDTPWEKLRIIGNEVISEFIKINEIDDISYFMAAVGASPWKNQPNAKPSQGYWISTVLTHMYRFIPHRLIAFWDKYSITKEQIQRYEFEINGELCYLECLGFVGKIERAFGGTYNFLLDGTTWRLPELRSYYDKYYNNFLELKDTYDNETKYYLDMAKYPSDSEIKQKFQQAKDAEDWSIFEQYLSDNYDTYADDFLSEISVGENISTLAGLWCVYDGNAKQRAEEQQPEEINHIYHEEIFSYYDKAQKITYDAKYREVGNTFFIFKDGQIILPKGNENGYLEINKEKYYAYSRPQGVTNPRLVDGTYIMEIDNNVIKPDRIDF